MTKFRSSLYQIIKYSNSFILACMFLVLLLQVITRKFFNSPFLWPEEVSLIAMVWVTFFGAYQCTVENSHLKMEFLERVLSEKSKVIISLISGLLMFTFLLITVITGYSFVQKVGSIKMPVSGVPMWFPYMIIWVSCGLMMLDVLFQIIN